MAHDIFISHAQADKPVADLVCATLERRGIRCWIAPRDIQPGTDWGGAIIAAIRQSRGMVLVFSDAANASRHIPRELERAIDLEIPIVPFRIENIPPRGSLEYNLALVHWLDAVNPPLEAHAMRLAEVVATMLGTPPVPMPVMPVAPPDPIDPFAPTDERPPDRDIKILEPPKPPDSSRTLAIWIGVGVLVAVGIVFSWASYLKRQNAPAAGSAPTTLSETVAPNDPAAAAAAASATAAPTPGNVEPNPNAVPDATSAAWKSCNETDPQSVIAGCTAVIQAKVEDPATMGRAFFNRAGVYYVQGNYDGAIADYTQALGLNFAAAHTYNNRGLAFAAKKDFGRAASEYEMAIEANAAFADPYCNLADLALRIDKDNKDNIERAIADYSRAISVDPKFARAFRERGGVYYRKQDYDNAAADFSSYLALKPDDKDVLASRGVSYALKGKLAPAIDDLSKALTLDPDNTDLHLTRAVVYLLQRDSERSLVDIATYITRNPNEAAGYRVRGLGYFQRGLLVLAKEDFARCLKLSAADAQALYAQGTAREMTGDKNGKDDIAAAVKIDPTIAELMSSLGVVRK